LKAVSGITRSYVFDPATPGEVRRVSRDDWPDCRVPPSTGPAVGLGGGTYHVAWYTKARFQGDCVFYARSRDGGANFFRAAADRAAGPESDPPYVMPARAKTAMVWKEFDGEKTTVNLMTRTTMARPGRRQNHLQHDGYLRYPARLGRAQVVPLLDDQADGYRIQPIFSGE